MNDEMKDVWGLLLRLFHWVLVISVVGLVLTGTYINDPWSNVTFQVSAVFPMATMRSLHFLAGYLFCAVVLVRLYLYAFGNRQERIGDIVPIGSRNIKSLITTLGYYSYLSDRPDRRLGHNVLAGIVYIITIVAALFQVLCGFYLLYPETHIWQVVGNGLFGSQQQGRLVHHLLMWYFILFSFTHVYMVFWNHVRSPEGLILSMFHGKKKKHKDA